MVAGGRFTLSVVIAVLTALPLFAIPAADDRVEDPNFLTQGNPQTQGWVPVQNVSVQLRVPPGREAYVYFDAATQTLKVQRLPDELAGLPPEVRAAAARAPDWIRPDLERTFARMAEAPIDPTAADDFAPPAVADMNGDGAEDLVLGNLTGTLTLYENIDPALHYLEGSDVYVDGVFVPNASFFPGTVKSVAGYSRPAIGDLNGDNLPDLLLGGGNGRVYTFMNAGPAEHPTWMSMGPIGTVSAVSFSAPALGDLDGDGDLDLMVGSAGGIVYRVYNACADPAAISDGNPATTSSPVWGGALALNLGIAAYSSPTLADLDADGRPEMAVGEEAGTIRSFSFNGASWVEDPAVFAGLSVGARAVPTLADLDGDGLADLAVGDPAGTVHYFPNRGTAAEPRFLAWGTYATGFNQVNFNQYYEEANAVLLTYPVALPRLLQYAAILGAAPQEMVDEIAFSIAHANTASLLNPAAFPEVYRNNTEALYFASRFTPYAEIVDYGLGTPDQWSTVRYRVNESDHWVWYEYPRDVYYWWLVSPKGTDELATFIDPTVAAAGHEGAKSQAQGGLFWRWAAFNLASPSWPADPGAWGYPKEEAPPVLRDKIANAAVLWNGTTFTKGAIYNDTGWFLRDGDGNVARPWNATDQAVEIVAHWVSSTLPLDAQRGNDGNRPRQPVRIQWEHNGNCGEISDMLWAGLRAALIPARGICGYGGDHCWGEFYERGWHEIDDWWDASVSIIADNEMYHYGWNRDWSGLMAVRGDGFGVDVVEGYHHAWSASRDAAYPPESRGLVDRANVTVTVRDADGHPLDGVKVALGDYAFYGAWTSFGTQWTFTDAEGTAYLYTSEARQNWDPNPSAGDPWDDGVAIYAISKMGATSLGASYGDRLKPSYGDAYNPRNAPMHYYNFTLGGAMPRTAVPLTPVSLPPAGTYALNVSYRVASALQHPAVAVRWNEGKAYHDLELATGLRVTSFFASEANVRRSLAWAPFEAAKPSFDAASGSLFAGLPDGEDWYFVLANPGTLETVQVVDLTAQLMLPTPETRSLEITPSMLGMRLMSLPIRPLNTSIESVLASLAGCYDSVRAYDPLDAANPWKSYVPAKSHNRLTSLDETMGFWIDLTAPCTFVVTGYPVTGTAEALRAGWNLVGYPSASTSFTVGDLEAALGIPGMEVEAFDPSSPPYYLLRPPATYVFRAWEGYWIYTPQDAVWVVEG